MTTLELLRALVPQIEFDVGAQDEFGRLVRTLLPEDLNDEEPVLLESFYESEGSELLDVLSRPFLPPASTGGAAVASVGGALADPTGGAAGLGNVFGGIKNGARNLLNLFTYYEMKQRAGVVGSTGPRPLLVSLQQAHPQLRIHLIEHSFGGRLVAATLGLGAGTLQAHSLSLLQAAFSHCGLASRYDGTKDELFRPILSDSRLRGPLLITYIANERAVGLAYPLASRFKRQVAAGIGDANDPYGGIGRNGALRLAPGETDESNKILRDRTDSYVALGAGKVTNLESGAYVHDYGAVTGPQVAHAILSAMLV